MYELTDLLQKHFEFIYNKHKNLDVLIPDIFISLGKSILDLSQ